MNKYTHEFPMEFEVTPALRKLGNFKADLELDLRATFTYSPGRPAYTFGLPESCYPEDPAELEVFKLELLLENKPLDISSWLENDKITDYVYGEVLECMQQPTDENL